tara:strand:- start:8688 stop:9770 length:1083 start_codon:yes stop_codon:yes gene_type:complete
LSKIISIDPKNIDKYQDQVGGHVLHGLPKGKYGFLISTPDTGKSYLCLSLAYEVASTMRLLGLAASNEPKKVLYWPVEDGIAITMGRISKHLKAFNQYDVDCIVSNLSLYESEQHLCHPNTESNYASERFLDDFSEHAKDYDLVIIDTVREATGACHEVKDDKVIKLALQKLAGQSGAAILLTHHLTKEASRGNEPITSVSGSGLSETLANSRYQIVIQQSESKRGGSNSTYLLSHVKKNYVPREHLFVDQVFNWSEDSLPYIFSDHSDNFAKRVTPKSTTDHVAVDLDMEDAPEFDYPEADSIDMNTVEVSAKSKELADQKRAESSIIKPEDVDGLREFKKLKEQKARSKSRLNPNTRS